MSNKEVVAGKEGRWRISLIYTGVTFTGIQQYSMRQLLTIRIITIPHHTASGWVSLGWDWYYRDEELEPLNV